MLKASVQQCGKALFHSSTASTAQATALKSKKLTKSLQPKSKAGRLEVAPRPSFERDDAPHTGRKAVTERKRTVRVASRSPPEQLGRRREVGGSGQSERRGRVGLPAGTRAADRLEGGARPRMQPLGGRDETSRRRESSRLDTRQQIDRAFPSTRHYPHVDGRDEPHLRRTQESHENSRSDARQHTDRDPPRAQKSPTIVEDLEIADEFYRPSQPVTISSAKGKSKASASDEDLRAQFTSPPLLRGILQSLKETLGPDARPTPIQSLSLKWLLESPFDTLSPSSESSSPASSSSAANILPPPAGWRQFLLASETGSGKSIAYLLPVLQNIKLAELNGAPSQRSNRPYNPRGLILAPTHELSRQLSGFAKTLLHETKLRVMCASQANVKNTTKRKDATSAKMASQFQETATEDGEFEVSRSSHPVDLLVGTPMKLLEMIRGRGWDRKEMPENQEEEDTVAEDDEENARKPRRGRDKMIGFGTWRSKPELGLANVEWVVVDEADVLFDPDFQETTRTLLSDISAARGQPVPVLPASSLQQSSYSQATATSTSTGPASAVASPIAYPFNLILTSATIPNSLNTYLETHHPSLIRLASPHLHHLPKTLQTEYVAWTGGNKFADILRRIKKIWAEDAAGAKDGVLSKVLVFCNKSAKVVELTAYLEEQGIKSVAMTSQSEHRGRGSNKHLEGFLRVRKDEFLSSSSPSSTAVSTIKASDPKITPHVMITTSLLSRGLDFSPEIKHVFIVDEPRNMVDFLHRAGRSGRAGERGKVVVFGKMEGRGSQRGRDVRKRVGLLVA